MPTATKEQKVQKIRNAEYYDFQGVQDTLYTQSKENKVFRKLMTIILSEENIMLAYRNIKKNTGSHTPGVDGKTIKDLSKWQEDSLITYIRTRLKHYIPQPVRRVEIPKANGKTRPLGIPTIMDRLIQQCVLQFVRRNSMNGITVFAHVEVQNTPSHKFTNSYSAVDCALWWTLILKGSLIMSSMGNC